MATSVVLFGGVFVALRFSGGLSESYARLDVRPPGAFSETRKHSVPVEPTLQVPATPRQLIGLERLEWQLGRTVPVGSGVVAGHVEGDRLDYMPSRFAAEYEGVRMISHSSPSKANQHAHWTAKVIYGPRGLAPGIQTVHFYTVADFLGRGVLQAGTSSPPVATEARLFNHSWVGRDASNVGDVLRRVDYLADVFDVMMVVGVDNEHNSAVPGLLSSAYNVVAVGQWGGQSSGGYTLVETAGRCKPDLVAPGKKTRYRTCVVTAAVARLLNAASQLATPTHATQTEVIHAVLLAGASKPAGWKWHPDRPLDSLWGAGRLRIDRSYSILVAGSPASDALEPGGGWHFDAVGGRQVDSFHLNLVEPAHEVALVLSCNRRIRGRLSRRQGRWLTKARMADLDLKLIDVDERGQDRCVATSQSQIDNVDHIYFRSLPAGQYCVQVQRMDDLDESWDYVLAWRIEAAGGASDKPHADVSGHLHRHSG